MAKTKQKALSLLLALAMMLSMLPVSALAASSTNSVEIGKTTTLSGSGYYSQYHSWSSDREDVATVTPNNRSSATVRGVSAGTATITHRYGYNSYYSNTENFTVTVTDAGGTTPSGSTRVYIYVKLNNPNNVDTTGWNLNKDSWYTIGYIDVPGLKAAANGSTNYSGNVTERNTVTNYIANNPNEIHYYNDFVQQALKLGDVSWDSTGYGLKVASGATDYNVSANTWHLDGLFTLKPETTYTLTVNYTGNWTTKPANVPGDRSESEKHANDTYTVSVPEVKGYSVQVSLNGTDVTDQVKNNQLTGKFYANDVAIVVNYTRVAPDKPTNDELNNLFGGKVQVLCDNQYAGHTAQTFGWDSNNTVGEVTLDETDDTYKVNVTLLASVYTAKYSVDGTTHNATASGNSDVTVTLTWDAENEVWVHPTTDTGYDATFHVDCNHPGFTVTYDGNGNDGGEVPVDSNRYEVNGTATVLSGEGLTKTGYTFGGWQEGDVNYAANNTITMTENHTLTAKWNPADNTKYTVKHYQEGLDGNYPENPTETEEKTGTTGTMTAAAEKTYEGFTAQVFQQAEIAADGSTVVSIYYTRNTYTVTYKIVGDYFVDNAFAVILNVKYGVQFPACTKATNQTGYIWNGWKVDNDEVPTSMPNHNVEVTGFYTTDPNTQYTVKHLQQNLEDDEYTEVAKQTLTGNTGAETEAVANNTYEGFTAQAFQQETIEADGSTVVSIYYDRNVHTITYKITSNYFEEENDEYEVIEDVKYGTVIAKISDLPTNEAMEEVGYVWSTWQGIPETMPDNDVTVTGYYSPAEGTAYQVKHHLQNVEGDGYTYTGTPEEKTGKTGDLTDAKAQEFTGFTVRDFDQETIAANGSTVVDIYYDRNTHDVVYKITGSLFTTDDYHTDSDVRYEAPLTLITDDMTKEGYTWSGWTSLPEKMPNSDVEVTGFYSPKTDTKYTVEHWMENATDSNHTMMTSEEAAGTTGAMTEAQAKEYTGFTARAFEQQEIKADGSTVVQIYYDRNVYQVTYKIVGNYFADEAFDTFTDVKYDTAFPTSTKDTARTGYIWNGWSETLPTTMPAEDVVITGSYTPMSDITYTVEHYQQNVEQTGYGEPETETLLGTTGELTAAIAKNYPGFTAQDFQQQTVAGDGSTVVKIYYNRNTYTVSYDLNGGTGAEGVSYETESFVFGAPVTVKAEPTKTDYDFLYWFDGTNASAAGATFNMPAGDLAYTAHWKASKQELTVSKTLATVNGKAYVSGNVNVGDELVYEITVTNSGNVDLEDIEVVDAMTGDRWTIDLAAGERTTLTTKAYVVLPEDAGRGLTNVATATAPGEGPTNSGSETVNVTARYTLTTSIDRGTISGAGRYDAGTTATVIFNVSRNYYITGVTVDGERASYVWDREEGAYMLSVLMDDDHTVVVSTAYDYDDDDRPTRPTRPDDGDDDNTTNIDDEDVPLAGDAQLNDTDHFAYIKGYEDGTVRPMGNITREEVATIFYRLLTDTSRAIYFTEENSFSDVDSSRWSNKAISTLANAGILTGYPDGTFQPGKTITRAEFAAIAARFDVVTETLENPFNDTTGHWGEQLISFAASKGWVTGYPDGSYKPEQAITRAEAMTLINRVLNRAVDKEGLLAEAKQWPDNLESEWYYFAVLEATNSHDYERRVPGEVMENWTALTADRVWDE